MEIVNKKDLPRLSLIQARRLALEAGAGFHKVFGHGKMAVANIVDRIGFIQIDTISVIQRAHHHVLATRIPSYRQEYLEKAQVFEYWAHAAAYLPWKDFRHTLPRKERIRAQGHPWFRTDREESDRVLARIRAEGPLMARDFKHTQKTDGWWDWKPAKRALEYLFQAGYLMVLPRKGFQKVFDLTERVLPADVDTRTPSGREHARWYVDRALDAWGLVAPDEIAYQRQEHVDKVDRVLAEMEEEGSILRIGVESIPETFYWIRKEAFERIGSSPIKKGQLKILSPFDPFLIHRKRIRRLFNFDFALECYLPVSKRSFGYFALPLFWRGSFVGLMDAKADRKAGVLRILRLRYDGDPKTYPSFLAALDKALVPFAEANGVCCCQFCCDRL